MFGSCCSEEKRILGGVADPGCLSRISDSDFYPSWITDPTTETKKEGEKLVVITFFVALDLQNLKLFLSTGKENNSLRVIVYFLPKNCH
jgi:hypothetical protein